MRIVIRGTCSNSGFGVATFGLIKTAIAAGFDVKYMPIVAHHLQHRKGFIKEDIDFLDSISIEQDEKIYDDILIDVGSLVYGLTCPEIKCAKKILYCTYETVRIHNDYVLMMNNKYDEIWTASKFNRASFMASGVTKPIKIIPHYLEFNRFNDEIKPFNIKNKKTYSFIYNADLSHRKGLHYLLPAFCETFKEDEDVCLILKLMMSDPDKSRTAPRIVESLNKLLFLKGLLDKPRPKILVLTEYMPYNLIANFYKTGDCYVAPHMGEGFCYPIAESMACGLPQITTRAAAPIDYVDDDCGYLVDLDEKNPVVPITDRWQLTIDPRYQGQSLYNVSIESLKEKMRYVFENKEDAKEKGLKAKEKIHKYLNIENLATIFKDLIG